MYQLQKSSNLQPRNIATFHPWFGSIFSAKGFNTWSRFFSHHTASIMAQNGPEKGPKFQKLRPGHGAPFGSRHTLAQGW